MLKKHILFILSAMLLIYACGTKKAVVSPEVQISIAFEAQNYLLVLQQFEQLEQNKKGTVISDRVIEMAGISAFKTGNWDKTHIYLTRIATVASSPEILGTLGTAYMNWGEKDMEYQHWNKYLAQLETSTYYNTATTRIFLYEVENEKYKEAQEIWTKISDKSSPDIRFEYLKVLTNLEQKTMALVLSQEILKEHPAHEPTLYWRAKYYFDKAENLYQLEMAKYNRSPDYTSYAYLRRELKTVSADFRTARDLFVKLHGIDADNLNYIRYLKNCYVRLEMKAEAKLMDQKLNEPLRK
jgi:hypothetical protein